MVALNTAYAPSKTSARSENRVGDFFCGAGERVRDNRLASRIGTKGKTTCSYETASVDTEYEYSPFGQIVRSSGSYADANAFRFSTKYLDTETGFYYYGYRHYDSATGRWLSRDPLGERVGPNLFCFIFNNAVDFWDLLGLAKVTVKVTTEIRQDKVYGPLGGKYEGGVKTEHSVTVDTDTGKISNDTSKIHDSTKVNWDGSTETKPGAGELNAKLTPNDDGSFNLNMNADADNPHLPSPHINYDVDVTINSSGEVTNLDGGMDGFPSSTVDINGGNVFDNPEEPGIFGPLSLMGDDDTKITDDNTDLSQQGKPCG
jgi:RHS repeat-associated protein